MLGLWDLVITYWVTSVKPSSKANILYLISKRVELAWLRFNGENEIDCGWAEDDNVGISVYTRLRWEVIDFELELHLHRKNNTRYWLEPNGYTWCNVTFTSEFS